MINVLGTFSLIWLALWCGLTLVFVLVYRLLRRFLMRLHPEQGSTLLLTLWGAPMLISFCTTMMLFLPSLEGPLVDLHCHGSCQQHAPSVDTPSLAWFGIAIASLLLAALVVQFAVNVFRGLHMHRQFDALATCHYGYFLLDADEPVVFTLGWWHPRVYVSRGMQKRCSLKKLAVILDHEEAHRRRRDNLRMLLARIFGVTLPPSWCRMLEHDLQLLSEQACDFAAARGHGALSVAETLVHIGRMVRRASLPEQSLGFNSSDLGHRVYALLAIDQRRRLSPWHLGAIALAVALLLLSTVNPLHHVAEWTIGFVE
jgi:hypothetical protein